MLTPGGIQNIGQINTLGYTENRTRHWKVIKKLIFGESIIIVTGLLFVCRLSNLRQSSTEGFLIQ